MLINIFIGVCLSKMLPSHINQLAEAYAQIAEGKKSEEEVKDWNRKDDNPEGKKVDKKKVDKCTCESFYLKRLQAMNPVYAEQYLALAEVLIGEGYESARLLDNIIEALPKEVVGHEFRAALQAVNPRIYENLHTAEKKQARAIAEFVDLSSWLNNNPNRAKKVDLKPFLDRQAQRTGSGTLPRVAEPYNPVTSGSMTIEPEKEKPATVIPKTENPRPDAFAPVKAAPAAPKPAAAAPKPAPAAPKPDPNADYKALQAKAKSSSAAGDFKAASAATRQAETLGQTKFKAKFGANYGRRSGMTPNPLMSANPPQSKMTYKTKNPLMDSHEVEGELLEGDLGDRARRVVGDQRGGYHGDADYFKKHQDAIDQRLLQMRPYGVKGFPSVKKDTKKTTQVAHFQPEGELVEGIRDKDPEKGTEERKERLEKKRGHKVDDHPQYKKDKKDDDSYLETNMKKRHENNEKLAKRWQPRRMTLFPVG